ncbi:transcriptional regulator Kaiso [Esox lucius]|uniref:Zinc finger and BTB domain containing 33 n=1 Tax=Esox lucius TaxID=8010 RepID=A0A3P9AH04_ESOLU|nr:transcriptional regulator Kaiso [Esox lucius]XP_010894564.2 transcriptional regulator Kaiso [Esox lucius]
MSGLKLISATDTQYSGTLLKSMDQQRNSGLFCDVTIVIQDRKFQAHKNILSASSTYFHQLLSVAGQVVELNFVKVEIFEEILNYIYSSKIVRVRSDMLEELITAGKTLGVKFIANLGVPLSQVKGLPGLSKDTENNDLSSVDKSSAEPTGMMPIITESFSLSAEEFNQNEKSADNEKDSDDDDIMFVSKTDAVDKCKPSEIIDLDGPDTEEDSVKEQQGNAGPALITDQENTVKMSPHLKNSSQTQQSQSLQSSTTVSPKTSSNIQPPPARVSFCSLPATPARIVTQTPETNSTSLPSENQEIVGIHKKQVTLTQRGDFKIKLSDVSSCGGFINEAGINIPQTAATAKKTITLDKASEIDSLSPGCKVYANIGENTYDIVPMKDDPGEGVSKNSKGGKRSLMATPLQPFNTSKMAQGISNKKKAKMEQEDHYELIMDGKTFFVCVVCKRPYVCLTSLRRHFNTHSWEKKYPCHYCDKVFALAEYRTKHEIHHTGERRYQCLLCNEMFLNYQLLSTHCKQAHNQDPSGRKQKDDTDNNLYRLLPCKTVQFKPYSYETEDSNSGGVPIIQEDGSIQHVIPDRGHLASPVQLQSTQGKMLNWDDIFVEPEAQPRPSPHVPRPGGHPAQPPPSSLEFEFVIPETY